MPKEGKEKKGFGKVLSRVKTVLRGEGSSSKRQSALLASKAAAPVEAVKKRYVID